MLACGIRYAKFIMRLFVLLGVGFVLSACNKPSSKDTSLTSFGLSIVLISGDHQSSTPDKLFAKPLKVQVVNDSGEGVKGIDVAFTETTSTYLLITTPMAVTGSDGSAQTSVRAPAVYNQASKVDACISGSSVCVTFNVQSDSSNQSIRFSLYTEHSDHEVAGVPFKLTVKTVDAGDSSVVDINSDIDLQWTFITSDSWSGVAATNIPPVVLTCTFVHGICDIVQPVTLVDSRVITQVFVGDGDGGYIDVFSHLINVASNVPINTLVTDKLGGPSAGATTIKDTVFTADDPDFTFYVAITDFVGNYIGDPANATWSSTNALEITSHLSTLSGVTSKIQFHESIPFPNFGTISATVTGYIPVPTGHLSIDPGPAANVKVIPQDGNYTRLAGEPFDFDFKVLDDKGNICGQSYGSTGFTGTFPVTISFSNYSTPPAPTGGTIPLLKKSSVIVPNARPKVSQTITVPFFGGRAQYLTDQITFWDAKGVTPNVTATIDATLDPRLPPTTTGTTTYSVAMNMDPATFHIMIRDGLGASANSLCQQSFIGSTSNWRTLPNIIRPDYLNGLKDQCSGLSLSADNPPVPMYGSIEDQAGNFIANISLSWITTDPDITVIPSLFGPMLSATSGVLSTLNPISAANLGPPSSWLRLQGTYNSVNYDQYLIGSIEPGDLRSFELRAYSVGPIGNSNARASLTNTLIVVPKDANGNELTYNQTVDVTVTVTNPPTIGNDAVVPTFISSGNYSLDMQRYFINPFDNLNDNTAVGKFGNLITPHAGDVINITVTATSDPSITGSLAYTVIPGDATQMQIRKDADYPAGTNVTNTNITVTADDHLMFYSVPFDSHLNRVASDATYTVWDTSAQPFVPANAFSGLIAVGNLTPFTPDKPGTGKLKVTKSSPNTAVAAGSTGVITILPGAPSAFSVSLPAYNITAGVPQNVTATLLDSKANPVTTYTAGTDIAINVLSNDITRLSFSQYNPPSGNYTFTMGQHIFTGAEAFKFYNALHQPRVQISTTSGTPIVGQSPSINVMPAVFDHLAVLSQYVLINAGQSNDYTIISEDAFGNKIDSGPDSSKHVTFNITSNLGDEDITASDILNPSIGDFSLPSQKWLTGDLSSGRANVTVTATKSGLFTASGLTTGKVGTNTEDPLTVAPLAGVTSLRYKPGSTPQSPGSTITALYPFTVEALDSFGNVITSNNTDSISLQLIGAIKGLGNYSPQTLTAGATQFSGLTYTVADSFTLRAKYTPDSTKFVEAQMTVEIGSVNRTVVKLQGQTWTEGTGSLAAAITGSPFGSGQITAGASYTAEVHAVDTAYNTVTTYTGSISLTSTDPYVVVFPASQNFVAGVATFTVTPRQHGAAHKITPVSGFTNQASTPYIVNVASASQLITLLPSQTLHEGAPNLATAQSGVVPYRTAGVSFTATVKAVDDYYNQVTTFSHPDIAMALGSDPSAPVVGHLAMSGGSVDFSVLNYKAVTGHTVTPSTASGPSLTSQTSALYEVKSSSATQYIAVFPGQNPAPGQAPANYAAAVTGTPIDQTTDAGFSVSVYAVDPYFNQDANYSGAVSIATPDDPNDSAPSSAHSNSFSGGVETFTITPYTASNNQHITVTTALAANAPATYNVKPGAAAKLVAIFKDYQTLNPGNTTTFVTGSVPDLAAGTAMNVRIYNTDNKYNVITTDNSTIVSMNHYTVGTLTAAKYFNLNPASKTLAAGIADFVLTTYKMGNTYHVTPSGGAFAANPSSDFNALLASGKNLLVILPGQTFDPGRSTAGQAASGPPFKQTVGLNYSFTAAVKSVDDYGNLRSSDTDSVVLSSSLAAATYSPSNTQSLSSGSVSFSLYHTSSSGSNALSATNGAFVTIASGSYQVIAAITNPTLALNDPTTNSSTYIRQITVKPTIGNDATAAVWCVSESQSAQPSSGTNGRTTCNGTSGGGRDALGWYTSRPSTTLPTTAGDGVKTFYVWIADAGDNVNQTAGTNTITLDTGFPTNPLALSLSAIVGGSTTFTNAANVNLNVTLDPTATKWCLIEQPQASAAPAAPLYNNCSWAGKPGGFPYTYAITTQGNRSVYVFAMDAANNISTSYAVASIWYDGVLPVSGAILGVTGGTDGVVDNWLGNVLTPTVSWQAATDSTTVTYSLTIKDSTGTSTICGPAQTTLTLLAIGGCTLTDGLTYTVYLTATDSALNASNATNNGFAFTVDVTPPTAFTVTGMTGLSDVTADAWLTDALTNPQLNWTASTGHTGYNVYITNTLGVPVLNCSASAGAGATSFQGFVGCTLADNTNYKMRVLAFDAAGNLTEASLSPFAFTTSQGIDKFQVDLVPASDPVAGAYFAVKLTALKKNLGVATNYVGPHNITWTSTGGTATDICGSNQIQTKEFANIAQAFGSGVVTTSSAFAMKVAQAGITITATDASAKTGTSAAFNVTAAATNCTRIETAAGGGGAALGAKTPLIDAVVNAFAVGRDAYGNFTSNQSVNWSGTGSLTNIPVPESGTSTSVVAVKGGLGTLVASGGLAAVNFNNGNGNVTWTTASNDSAGHARLSSSSVTAVFDWTVTNDSVNAWRTAGWQSWYSEVSANRGVRSNFPSEAILVASNSGLDVIDASTNSLYLRFQSGAGKAVDSNYGYIVDVTALNGKIYLSMDSGATGAVIIIDLANDKVFRVNHFISDLSGNTILNRNSAAIWSGDPTYPVTTNSRMGKLYSRTIATVDYLAIATTAGVELMRTSDTATVFEYATANAVKSVALTSNGKLYFSQNNVGTHRADLTLPLLADFSPTVTYTDVSPAHTLIKTFNDIAVSEGTSSVDPGNNTLVIATALGLTVIQEHATFNSSTSLTYGKLVGTAFGAVALFAGASENVLNIDIVVSGLAADVHMITSSGWMEIRNVQTVTPTQFISDTTIVPSDVKAYHSTAFNQNDVILGLSTTGLQLRRR